MTETVTILAGSRGMIYRHPGNSRTLPPVPRPTIASRDRWFRDLNTSAHAVTDSDGSPVRPILTTSRRTYRLGV
jgi:hypothetical protein